MGKLFAPTGPELLDRLSPLFGGGGQDADDVGIGHRMADLDLLVLDIRLEAPKDGQTFFLTGSQGLFHILLNLLESETSSLFFHTSNSDAVCVGCS